MDDVLDTTGLLTLAAVDRLGTFEAAARELHVTPSAVSQRIKAVEARLGRVVVSRTKPTCATDAGQVLLRVAAQWEVLQREAVAELTGAGPRHSADAPHAHVPLVVNADTLATWILPALAQVQGQHRVVFELLREDEGHSTDLLRQGRVLAAVTSDPRAVHGCRVVRLGRLRYVAVATPDFVDRWLPDGPTPAGLAHTPVVCFDRKDTQQEMMLRRLTRRRLSPPTTYIPSSRDFEDAVRWGLGWGMLPERWVRGDLERGRLVSIAPGRRVHADVTLHWQHWRLGSPMVQALTAAVQEAARAALYP